MRAHGVDFELSEHAAAFNMADLDSIELPYPDCEAKNLFIRDDKKRKYCLITVKGDKRVDLKKFRKDHGFRPLCFASAEDLMNIMKLIPGAVTPLGLLNDEERRVVWYVDKCFLGGIAGVHPNDNRATVWMRAEELIRVIKEHGNEVHMLDLDA
ncbi:MAG: prolyl-tRNA synthetase associated domain-containing protein [Oscillospiraceae bacterium]|nr:prolyl-tRNA synthetase associated domain-containing protein [Oscillospiraceae bacterium]